MPFHWLCRNFIQLIQRWQSIFLTLPDTSSVVSRFYFPRYFKSPCIELSNSVFWLKICGVLWRIAGQCFVSPPSTPPPPPPEWMTQNTTTGRETNKVTQIPFDLNTRSYSDSGVKWHRYFRCSAISHYRSRVVHDLRVARVTLALPGWLDLAVNWGKIRVESEIGMTG